MSVCVVIRGKFVHYCQTAETYTTQVVNSRFMLKCYSFITAKLARSNCEIRRIHAKGKVQYSYCLQYFYRVTPKYKTIILHSLLL